MNNDKIQAIKHKRSTEIHFELAKKLGHIEGGEHFLMITFAIHIINK